MPKKSTYRKRGLGTGSGMAGGKGGGTGLGPMSMSPPQTSDNQQSRYPKSGGKNSRPNSKK